MGAVLRQRRPGWRQTMGERRTTGLGKALGDTTTGALRHTADAAANPMNLLAKYLVHNILMLPAVQDIAFETLTVKVDGQTFRMVWSAILQGKITVRLMDDSDPDKDIGAAVYLCDANLMKLASLDLA